MAADNWSEQIDFTKWKFWKHCQCGGVAKAKYTRIGDTNKQIHILMNRGTYRIMEGKKAVKQGVVANLKTALETYE